MHENRFLDISSFTMRTTSLFYTQPPALENSLFFRTECPFGDYRVSLRPAFFRVTSFVFWSQTQCFEISIVFAHYRHEIKTNEMVVIFASRCQYGRYFQFPIASSSRNVSVRLLVPEFLKIKKSTVAMVTSRRACRGGKWGMEHGMCAVTI